MYKFLLCRPQPDANETDWCYSFNSKMKPVFNDSVKEAILVGYYSRKQDKWITSGTAIHLVENYKKVYKAFPDTEMCLILLGNKLMENKSDNPYFRFYGNIPDEYM